MVELEDKTENRGGVRTSLTKRNSIMKTIKTKYIMTTFNNDFYQANRSYTRVDAENRLLAKGIKNFNFTGESYSNGASFYFELESGRKVRVSDHRLTGNRAFDYIQIDIQEIKQFAPANKNN